MAKNDNKAASTPDFSIVIPDLPSDRDADFKRTVTPSSVDVVSLGGRQGEDPTHTVVRGWYLGSRDVVTQHTGENGELTKIHYVLTADGPIGLWGGRGLDEGLSQARVSQLVRCSFHGWRSLSGNRTMRIVTVDVSPSSAQGLPRLLGHNASAADPETGNGTSELYLDATGETTGESRA